MTENISPRHARERDTKDLALAAYAHMRGLKILRAVECRRGRANEYQFLFDDPAGEWDQIAVDFTNSEAIRFDNSVRGLKKLCKTNSA